MCSWRAKVNAPDRRPQSPQRTRAPRIRLLVLAGIALAGAAALYWRHERPRRLFDEATEIILSRPETADRLLEQSVEAAGGNYPEAQLLRCRALGSMGRWDEALGLFSMIDDKSVCSPSELLLLAQKAHAAGQRQLELMTLVAANRPGSQQAKVLRQLIALELEESSPDEVLEHCGQLAGIASDDPFPWLVEGRLYRKQKDPLASARAYREALRHELNAREQQETRTELAGALMDAGEIEEARKEMDRLLVGEQLADDILLKDAYLCRLEGKTEEALRKAERLVSKSPASSAALMLRGILYFDLARFSKAAEDLSQVVAAQPFNKEAHYKLGQAFQKSGQPDQAAAHLNRSAELTQYAVEILSLEPLVQSDSADHASAGRLVDLYERVGRMADEERLRRINAARE
jgi:tetratricopeptide (TPR) repeat protein